MLFCVIVFQLQFGNLICIESNIFLNGLMSSSKCVGKSSSFFSVGLSNSSADDISAFLDRIQLLNSPAYLLSSTNPMESITSSRSLLPLSMRSSLISGSFILSCVSSSA